MEHTFISIHDISQDARVLYVSNSITSILGYQPEEIVGKSCWDYFHPDEIPFARAVHGRGVQLDKAAVLNYCQIMNKEGVWVGCECVFSVVHDVLVACTSIYRRGEKSQKRSEEAPVIRQLFSSSPRDPRYHMLSYISSKFAAEPRAHIHEPRAALFLNRFTRTLTIMYATNGLANLLGISANELNGKSFYYCIQENCLAEAVRCLESAKENDSIAYLRFWFRDPREDGMADAEDTVSDVYSSDMDEEEGGVGLDTVIDRAMDTDSDHPMVSESSNSASQRGTSSQAPRPGEVSESASGRSVDAESSAAGAVFEHPTTVMSSNSTFPTPEGARRQPIQRRPAAQARQIELEAVVSCTSDGLVVILRGARPFLPSSVRAPIPTAQPIYANGIFASPWALHPIVPPLPQPTVDSAYTYPGLMPTQPLVSEAYGGISGPRLDDVMASIRDVAVFAWSLVGINGSLSQYGRGKPKGQSVPPAGLPIWAPGTAANEGSDQYNGLYGVRPPNEEKPTAASADIPGNSPKVSRALASALAATVTPTARSTIAPPIGPSDAQSTSSNPAELHSSGPTGPPVTSGPENSGQSSKAEGP